MESENYKSAIKGFNIVINSFSSEMIDKKTEYEKAKRDLYSIIEDKRKYIETYKKIACKECFGCDCCDNKDELSPNWECSKGYELGTKCEHFNELPF